MMSKNAVESGDLPVILRAEKIRKVYPGTIALKSVDFNVYRGKVNVLVGENGAGKSTLMKILAGVERPSSGSLFLEGKNVHFHDPAEAADNGIGIIYQELNLFPNLDVSENIFINREQMKNRGWINHEKQKELAADLMTRLGQDIDPSSLVRDLKVGQQQIVEIAKALSGDASILIMDEPTSALSEAEVEVLFNIIDELKAKGVSIIYISHRLDELLQIGDYITVLRDGNLITEKTIKEVDLQWIVRNMVGGEADTIFHSNKRDIGDVVLEVKDIKLPAASEGMTLDGISFSLRAGEVLGLYGLLGAGRSETLEVIMGLYDNATGSVILDGKIQKRMDIGERIRSGITLVPEDRQREGLISCLSVSKNITLSGLWRLITMGFHIVKKKETDGINEMFEKMSIKASSPDVLVSSLSGGNQQKVVIGKSLLTKPKVLLMDEPTRGIDVGAKGEVFNIMNAMAAEGLGVIFVTSEIKELRAICDRIIVLSKGEITGDFSKEEATEKALIDASAVGHMTTSQRNMKGDTRNGDI